MAHRHVATLLIPCLLIALGLSTLPATAATYTLPCDTTALENAIADASSNSQADTIELQAGCWYTLTSTLTVAEDGGSTLTINGNGGAFNGDANVQVLDIQAGAQVVLNDITITNGSNTSDGGGISNEGTLTISDSTIGYSYSTAGSGGGVYNSGTLTLTRTTVTVGGADVHGGGIYNEGTLTVSGSTFSESYAANGNGGAIYNEGTLTVSGSTFSLNSSETDDFDDYGDGGAIYTSDTATITGSTFTGNEAQGLGGAIHNDLGDLFIISSTIADNSSDISGGGVSVCSGLVEITSSVIRSNDADFGGGVAVCSGVVSIRTSTISENRAEYSGGIENNGGELTITSSIIRANEANNDGAGITNTSAGELTLTNSLVSSNIKNAYGDLTGAGIVNAGGIAFITNSTISGNSADSDGGILNGKSSLMVLENSLIAGNSGGDCADAAGVGGALYAYNSLIGDGLLCVSGDNVSNLTGDPLLSADFRPLAGSPAIDAGSNALVPAGLVADLSGVPRIRGARVDIGAYEAGEGPAPTTSPADRWLTDNLGGQTGGAITGRGGLNMVSRDGRIGNLYARVLALSGAYVTPNAPAEIGLQRLLDLGIYHAINLYGLLDDGTAANTLIQPLEICMRGTGEVLFVAAADPMRTIVRLASVDRGGYACVMLPSAGLLVMVNTPSGLPPQGSAPAASPAQADTPFTAFCQVRTTALVNLRAAPSTSAAILAEVPFGTTVTATARNAAGFYLVSYGGQMGYLSSAWATELGTCS
jgi:hypothetical protein